MTGENLWHMILTLPLGRLFERFPVSREFFRNLRLEGLDTGRTLSGALEQLPNEGLEDFGLDRGAVLREFSLYLETFAGDRSPGVVLRSLTILGGHDKGGKPETGEWTVSTGETVSIVGPTGAGKSRLLADIECLADGDSPTGRRILINGARLDEDERGRLEGRLVAQLSQNMNFVMDLTVREFLEMHAESRQAADPEETVRHCFACANDLAGEKFGLETKVTQLSGGQSRALMIADTAHMSSSPIVLIDEIENAGIDRRRAIELLARKEKIVFISTHDPLLALSADKRLIIRNGGVASVRETSVREQECLGELERLDGVLTRLRNQLRQGGEITTEIMNQTEDTRCGTSLTP